MFLERCRVLDLTDENGLLCGRILADLGADVIKVERPGGDGARRVGPLMHGPSASFRSLFWSSFNLNKKSITLDVLSDDGKHLLRRLAQSADILIQSHSDGRAAAPSLGWESLHTINPRLIVIAITPFGRDGPYSAFHGSDLVLMAMGGLMYLTGDEDRPPVRIGFPQAWLHAAGNAAVAGLAALCHRDNTGRGQLVDVSAQASLAPCMMNAIPHWEMGRLELKRSGSRRSGTTAAGSQRQTWPCKDGFITYAMLSGRSGVGTNRALAGWIDSEGLSNESLRKIDWDAFELSTATVEQMDLITSAFGRFFLTKTRRELYEGAISRRIMIYPVYSPRELLDDEQLRDRGFFVRLGNVAYPGSFMKASNGLVEVRGSPEAGEHNGQVYCGELGILDEELATLEEAGVI